GLGAGAPGRDLADVRGGALGEPLLTAVQHRAGELRRPRPRARRLPGRGAHVLVAGPRAGPGAAPNGPRGARPVPAAPAAAQLVPGHGDPVRERPAVRALRD